MKEIGGPPWALVSTGWSVIISLVRQLSSFSMILNCMLTRELSVTMSTFVIRTGSVSCVVCLVFVVVRACKTAGYSAISALMTASLT